MFTETHLEIKSFQKAFLSKRNQKEKLVLFNP